MKALLSAIMLFGFLWTQFYNSAVMGLYQIDKTAYIEEYCENTQMPELHCDGKCHLSDQLIETNNTSNPNEIPTLLPQQDLFTYNFIDIDETTDSTVECNFPNHQFSYNSPFYKIERPPKV